MQEIDIQCVLSFVLLLGLWTENNPLEASKLMAQIQEIQTGSHLRELGLDTDQVYS